MSLTGCGSKLPAGRTLLNDPDGPASLIGGRVATFLIHNSMKKITMRQILAALVHECGEIDGRGIFEWYCKTYGVTVVDLAPASVAREVLGL